MAIVNISDELYQELQERIKTWDSPASPQDLVELAITNFLAEFSDEEEGGEVELEPALLAEILEAEASDEADDTPIDEVFEELRKQREVYLRERKVSA